MLSESATAEGTSPSALSYEGLALPRRGPHERRCPWNSRAARARLRRHELPRRLGGPVWRRSDIYGARVSPAGAVLDRAGSRSRRRRTTRRTRARLRRHELPRRLGGRPLAASYDIYGARVSPAGSVLDPSGISDLGAASAAQARPALAFDGTNYLVVWRRPTARSPPTSTARRVSPAGVVLDPGGIPISATRCRRTRACARLRRHELPRRLGRPRGFYDIYGARVSRGGTVLDPSGIQISTARRPPGRARARLRRHELPRRLGGLPLGHCSDVYGARVSPGGACSTRAGSRSRPERILDQRDSRRWPSTARTTSSPGTTSARRRPGHLRRAREPGGDGARPERDRDLDRGGLPGICPRSPSTARTTSSPGGTRV